MSESPDSVTFIKALPSGSASYFIEFPASFANPPAVNTSLSNNNFSDEILPYILSDISNVGFYIQFGDELTSDTYVVNVTAAVDGSFSNSSIPIQYNGTKMGVLATQIYDQEIGFYTSGAERTIEIGLIANWLKGHLGELNTLIFTCLSGYNPENFNLEEQAIIREMYLSEYNRKAHRRVLRGIDGSDGSPDFRMIKEGDSVIQRSDKNATAKNYHEAYLASQERVKELVYAYNIYGSKPNQVAGGDAPNDNNTTLNNYY